MGKLVAADSKLMALLRLAAQNVSVAEAAKRVGISRATACRWLDDPANKEILKRLIQERVPDIELTPAHILARLSQLANSAQLDGDFKVAGDLWIWLYGETKKLETMPHRGVINVKGVELHKALGGADDAQDSEALEPDAAEAQPDPEAPAQEETGQGDGGVHVDAGEVPSDDLSDVLRGEAAQ